MDPVSGQVALAKVAFVVITVITIGTAGLTILAGTFNPAVWVLPAGCIGAIGYGYQRTS